ALLVLVHGSASPTHNFLAQEVIQSSRRVVLVPGTGDSAPGPAAGTAGNLSRCLRKTSALRKEGPNRMKRPLALVWTLAVTAGLLAGRMVAPTLAGASSHREAPGISNDPTADNTDLYAFVSPDKPDTVTIIANYIPLQDPAGGPNFSTF